METGIFLKHKLAYCAFCRSCDNNCCTGGYGYMPDGSQCVDCPSAHAEQDKMWEFRNKKPSYSGSPEEKLLREIFKEQ